MALEAIKPRICWGVKDKGSKRLKCGEEVDDPRIVEETMKLINEFLNRVERYEGLLLSDENTPFDKSIRALNNWLQEIKAKIKKGYDESITKLRRAILDVGKKMLKQLKQAKKKWFKTYRQELEELIEKLRNGKAKVIISGDPFNKDRGFIAYLYAGNLAIEVARVAGSGSITMRIALTGLKGVHVITPKLFDDSELRAMQYGLLLTDGSIHKKGYLVMDTNQLWQAIAWPLTWPGKNHVYVHGISLNDSNVDITWHLTAMEYKDSLESKAVVAEEVSKLSNEEFLLFLLFAILGDGDVNIEKKRVRLAMGKSKHKLWGEAIKRLEGLGFRENDRGHVINYVVKSSKAVDLARRTLSDLLIKALIDDLSALPDAEKLRRLITLVGMRIKPRGGRFLIEVASIKMSVYVNNSGCVEVRVMRKDYGEAKAILERLKGAGYEEVELGKWGNYFVVYMGMDTIRKHPELTTKVCEVLKRMHDEVIREGNVERAWRIAKAMKNLGCQ